MNNETQKLLHLPIVAWEDATKAMRGADLERIENDLEALIQRATLLEAYISHRYNTGCGDQGHDASVKRANATLVKIRKALGFSYPANTPLRMT